MRTFALLILLLAVQLPAPLAAQWRVGLDLGIEHVGRFIRSASTQDPDAPDGRPTQGWPLGLRIIRGEDGLRASLGVTRIQPGLELFGDAVTVALRPGFEVLTVTPELSSRLGRLAGGGQLRATLALPLERWSFPTFADPPQWRVGAALGVAVEVPLTGRLTGRVAAALGTVFRNPLAGTDVTEGYQPTALWRRSLRIGVQWRP